MLTSKSFETPDIDIDMTSTSQRQPFLSYADHERKETTTRGHLTEENAGFEQQRIAIKRRTFWIIGIVCVLSNIVTAYSVATWINRRTPSETHGDNRTLSPSLPIVEELSAVYSRFKWWTPWGLESGTDNDTNVPSVYVTDELWNNIKPSHGIVAVDRTWAAERHWPPSMYLPKDPHGRDKGVYLLEAYHLIHCLKIIRLSFVEARRGVTLTWPVGHTTHCFDALRQSIQCNADNTPLYTFGDMTAGDGQLRKCRSWDELRQWATDNSACYQDSVLPIPLRDHFGFCEQDRPYHDGDDGLERG